MSATRHCTETTAHASIESVPSLPLDVYFRSRRMVVAKPCGSPSYASYARYYAIEGDDAEQTNGAPQGPDKVLLPLIREFRTLYTNTFTQWHTFSDTAQPSTYFATHAIRRKFK